MPPLRGPLVASPEFSYQSSWARFLRRWFPLGERRSGAQGAGRFRYPYGPASGLCGQRKPGGRGHIEPLRFYGDKKTIVLTKELLIFVEQLRTSNEAVFYSVVIFERWIGRADSCESRYTATSFVMDGR